MKIEAKVKSYETKEIDVEFPCYVKRGDTFDGGGWYDKYTRYAPDGTAVFVTEYDDHWEFEPWNNRVLMDAHAVNLGYHLIENDHRSTPEEFYAALDRMIAALQAVPR